MGEKMLKKLKENNLWKYTLVFPVYFICFYIIEYFIRDNYHVMYMPLDDLIPFCEWFAIPYILWMPMLVLTALYLLYRDDTAGYKLYMVYVGISFLSTLAIYAIFPNGQELRVTNFENPNLLTDFVQYLYSCDTNTNVCPSLHVIGSFAAVFGVFHRKPRSAAAKICIIAAAFLIAVSTVFIKQHSAVDVIAGVCMSVLVWVIVYSGISPIRKRVEKL